MKNKNSINYKKIILATIATAGLVSIAVVAPNALQTIGQFTGKNRRNKKYYAKNVIGNLMNKGFIKFKNKNGKKFIHLTKKGEQELLKYELGDLKIKEPRKWDKKWRIVIFDIKEKRRKTRDILRDKLNKLGFVRLQNSVWVFPYDCEELIVMLKSNLFVGKDILYITANNVENDKWLKEVFGLN